MATVPPLNQITRQSDVTSLPHRENYDDLRNTVNNNDAELQAVSIGTTNAETTATRPYHTSLSGKLNSLWLGQQNYLKIGGAVAERSTPAYEVQVSALQAQIAGVTVRKGFGSWARSGATITMTEEGHGRSNGNTIVVEVSTDTGALPLQAYTISGVTSDTFVVTGIATGATSGTAEFATVLTPAVAPVNTRLDYVAFQSDNSLTLITGADAVDPSFPAIATTQLILGSLVIKSGTATLNEGIEIFTFIHTDDVPDHYIGTATTINQGKYNFNNLIIDAAVTLDCTSTSGFQRLQRQNVIIKCKGIFHNTSNGTIVIVSPHNITNNGDNGSDAGPSAGAGGSIGLVNLNNATNLPNFSCGYGGNGEDGGGGNASPAAANGGDGGGGGASIVAAGGSGGAGGSVGGGSTSTDGIKGAQVLLNNPFLFVKASDYNISANITFDGANGGDGANGALTFSSAGGGGAGGGAGGIIILIADKDITINASATISANGGDGGDGGSATAGSDRNGGGGGGGSGSGGLLLFRSKTYTNNGTVVASAGSIGAGGSASGGTAVAGSNGVTGGAGIIDQALYGDLSSDLLDNILPINIFGLDI